jgi:alkylation response protein AidB-like acyl-CoA dehydrogenase
MNPWALTPDQVDLQARARDLARTVIAPRAADVDRTEAYPWDNVAALRDAGFTGMTVPASLGGRGHSFLDAVLVVEEMAKVCGVTGRIAVEANMGAISAILQYGTSSASLRPNWFCRATNRRSASPNPVPARRRRR